MTICINIPYTKEGATTVRCPSCKVKRRIEADTFSFGGILSLRELEDLFASEELVMYAYYNNTTYTYSLSHISDLYNCCQINAPDECSTSSLS